MPIIGVEEGDGFEEFRKQLLVTLIKRSAVNNKLSIPVSEIDNTGQDILSMKASDDHRSIIFTLSKKQ